MEAYLVPVLAAFAGAFLTASVLGAVRLGRWWALARGRAAAAGAAAEAPGPGIPEDASDPHYSRLAHRSLGAALLIGLAVFFLFVRTGWPPAHSLDLPATASLLAAWAVARSPR